MRLGFAFTEVNQRVGSIEGKIGELEGKIDELDDFCQEPEELRESWLERNVAAEGEVVVLRERVDQQERTIQRLEMQVERALNLIHDLRTAVTPGELLFAFYIMDIDFL